MVNNKKITYLFGAGASAGEQKLIEYNNQTNKLLSVEGIPVVKNFNADIRKFLDLFEERTLFYHNLDLDKVNQAINFYKEFISLYNEFEHVYSYDTFAKKLFEMGEIKKLSKLKFLLKAYLIFRQNVTHRDKRYDLFFATLINKGKISTNVNFISWNYDTQIEMSLNSFNTHNYDNKSFLKFVATPYQNNSINSDYPAFIKLNGSISYEYSAEVMNICHTKYNLLTVKEAILLVLDAYEKNNRSAKDDIIEFSWEESKHKKDAMEVVYNVMEKTDILVVIGYSFPTLNRDKDRQILKGLDAYGRIFIQCRNDDFNNIVTRIKALLPQSFLIIEDTINEVNSIDEFYIPFELN